VISFVLSVLARQPHAAELRSFRNAYPYDWLVREEGDPAAVTTLPPGSPAPLFGATAGGSQSLAIALKAKDGSSEQVVLGRGEQSDIVLNDGTLSSLHLVFMRGPGGWTVRDAGSKNGTTLEGVALQPGQPKPLLSGARLRAGSVVLRYYAPPEMLVRLRTPT
jgi:hypothetical protein